MKYLYQKNPMLFAFIWFICTCAISFLIPSFFNINAKYFSFIVTSIFFLGLWYASSEHEIHLLPSKRKIYHQNKELIRTCYTLVKSYESPDFLSSWSYINQHISTIIFNNNQLFTEEDYLVISHRLLLEISSSLLSSGEFHLTESTLSSYGPTHNLSEVYNHSLLWLKEKKFLNDSEAESLQRSLRNNIHNI
ncbi:MAG: hypothetical protein K6G85_03810 [Eubacterium sp.]|nr:hypothetical protein [Eubacterium sp.]